MTDLLQQISAALAAFTQRPPADAAIALFETLGYRSEKRLAVDNLRRSRVLSTACSPSRS